MISLFKTKKVTLCKNIEIDSFSYKDPSDFAHIEKVILAISNRFGFPVRSYGLPDSRFHKFDPSRMNDLNRFWEKEHIIVVKFGAKRVCCELTAYNQYGYEHDRFSSISIDLLRECVSYQRVKEHAIEVSSLWGAFFTGVFVRSSRIESWLWGWVRSEFLRVYWMNLFGEQIKGSVHIKNVEKYCHSTEEINGTLAVYCDRDPEAFALNWSSAKIEKVTRKIVDKTRFQDLFRAMIEKYRLELIELQRQFESRKNDCKAGKLEDKLVIPQFVGKRKKEIAEFLEVLENQGSFPSGFVDTLVEFVKVGVQVPMNLDFLELADSIEHAELNPEWKLQLLCRLGEFSFQSEPTGSSLLMFDIECVVETGEYANMALRLAAMASLNLKEHNLRDSFDPVKKEAWLELNGKGGPTRWTLRVDDDWMDKRLIGMVEAFVGQESPKHDYYWVHEMGQELLVLYGSEKIAQELGRMTGVSFLRVGKR